MSELRHFDEEEDILKEPNIEEEEEEEVGELIVIDNELIESLKSGIEKSNPNLLAQSVDIILGFLGYKQNFVADEDLSESPLRSILPSLISKLTDLYAGSKEGSAKREKVNRLLEMLSAAVFDSFEKFKKDQDLFELYCKGFVLMKEFVDDNVAESAFVNASKLGLQKDNYRSVIFQMFSHLLKHEKFSATVLQMQYAELVKSNNQEVIENLLPSILEFYISNKDDVLPYVKSLVKRLSSELMNTMSQSDKSMISWRTLATSQLIAKYMIETKERRLLYPVNLIFTSFLRHFPIKVYLPFQLKILNIIRSVSSAFEVYTPVLCWITDAIQFICTVTPKGSLKFNWDSELLAPQHLSFEYCHGALENLKKVFFSNLLSECESIAFPEYVMPIKKRLESILATKTQFSGEVRPLIHQITEQQNQLVKYKKEVEWKSRHEQLSKFQEKVKAQPTPLKTALTKQSKIEAAKERMKQMKPKKQVDETGDVVQVATIDDV